jgi:hypothetical protein
MMGIYLIIIGLADELYRDRYLWEDVAWRQSAVCRTAGFCCMLSSVTSSCLLCLLAMERAAFSVFPSNQSVHSLRLWHAFGAGAWIVGIVLAATPVRLPESKHAQSPLCLPFLYSDLSVSSREPNDFAVHYLHSTT